MAWTLDPGNKVTTYALVAGMMVMAGSLVAIAYSDPSAE